MASLSRLLAPPGAAALLAGCLAQNPYYVDPTTATGGEASTTPGTTIGGDATTTGTTTDDDTSTTDDDEPTTTTSSTTAPATTDPSTTGVAPFCGDGYVDAGEACDDGNDVEDDLCTNTCDLPVCGDAIIHEGEGEACDNGPLNGEGNACTDVCQLNVCGDGVLGPNEACDDGNQADGDGCSKQCALEKCGNGVIDAGEACDDGNQVDTDGCTVLCVPPPALLDFALGGPSPKLGPGGGDSGGSACEGLVVGLEGDHEDISGVLVHVSSRCLGDYQLESIGDGVFRLIQAMPPVSMMEKFGGAADAPKPFTTACGGPASFLWGIEGYATPDTLTQLTLLCAELWFKPVNGAYKLFPQVPVKQAPVGAPVGMPVPQVHCGGIPGAIPTGFNAEGGAAITSLTLECKKPVLAP